MSVEVGAQIDVALGPLQGSEISADVVGLGRAVDHRRDHEGGVYDLAEAELFGEIVRSVEQGDGRRAPFQEQLKTAKQHALLKRQFDRVARQILLERLYGDVV